MLVHQSQTSAGKRWLSVGRVNGICMTRQRIPPGADKEQLSQRWTRPLLGESMGNRGAGISLCCLHSSTGNIVLGAHNWARPAAKGLPNE